MAQTDATAGDNRLLPLMREAVLMVQMLIEIGRASCRERV